MLTIPFIPICFRWLQWLVRKKQSYCTIPKIWRISGGFRLFSPLWYRCLLHSFWYQPILKYTHFTSLIFCLLICSASELSVTCPIRGSPLASSRGSILVLMPSIDASLLPFFSLLFSLLPPVFLLFLSYPSAVPSLPSYQSLTLCLSLTFLPSFSLHIHCYHTSSVPSLHLSHRSFSLFLFFLPLTLSPHPLAHSLPPSSRHLSLSLWWLAGVSGSPTGHLSPSSQLHSLAAPFFLSFVGLFYEWRPSDRRRWEVEEPRGSLRGNKIPLLSLKCVTMEMCVNRAPVLLSTSGVLGSLNCFLVEALHRAQMGLHSLTCQHLWLSSVAKDNRYADMMCCVSGTLWHRASSAKYPWKPKTGLWN